MKAGKLFGILALSGSMALSAWCSSATHADTLTEALRNAYRNNPTLNAERARQRATDEQVPIAKSGWRPTITTQAGLSHRWADSNSTSSNETTPLNLSATMSQPLFRGFKTVEGIKSAKANVKAGRENLIAVEQQVLFNAVLAYMDVIRDRQILAIRQRNVANLQKQARAAQARFDVGEVTRTDVSQARARVSGAQAEAAFARAQLETSIANYLAVVGKKPGTLKPAPRAKTPPSLDRALSTASEINPNILAAAYLHDASRHDVKVAKGDLLPNASLQASAALSDDITGHGSQEDATIGGVVNVPIYQSGREYALVRQAKQISSQRQIQIIVATRAVRQQVAIAWANLASSRQAIVAAQAQVSASSLALEGLNQEYLVGSRTTIDVLNAEQELLTARITLVSAQHDEIVASYQLLAAIGKLTARNLGLGDYYDPVQNYDVVKNKWIGLDVNTVQ